MPIWDDDYFLVWTPLEEDPYEQNDLGEDPAFEAKRNELIHRMLREYVTTERYPNPMPEIEVKRQAGWLNRP